MTQVARKALRAAILAQLDDDMMPLTVGAHTITDQPVYAGCSQWCGCDRDWDSSRAAYAYIVDGQYQMTFPDLSYFDGHNNIERQSAYYLQPDRGEEPPSEAIGEPLLRVPDKVLLEIAAGLEAAITAHGQAQSAQDEEAIRLAAALVVTPTTA